MCKTGNPILTLPLDLSLVQDTKRLVSISSKATHDLKSRLMSPTAIKKLKEDEVRILGQFVDLLDKMLSLEPGKRPSPKVSFRELVFLSERLFTDLFALGCLCGG